MNQAAQTTERSPAFTASYQTIANKRGKKIATMAIARKLPSALGSSYRLRLDGLPGSRP